jgi:MSHA biogenesis protein MshG
MLSEVAGFYEREVAFDLKSLSEKIEPIMLLAVGALVLMLAMGVFLPMWDLAGAARGHG